MAEHLKVMVIFAHPDEGEIYAGGVSALYAQQGHAVKFVSLTNGDAGHYEMAPAALAARRYQEAMRAQEILGLTAYDVLDYHDGQLQNTAVIQQQVADLIIGWQADIVFTFYPAAGGHNDNMTAGWIVRDAVHLLPNDKLPVFIYMRDFHTSQFAYLSDIAVIIDEVWPMKLAACGAHESQVLEYNPNLIGVLDEVQTSEEKQIQFLFENTYAFSHVRPDNLFALQHGYGAEHAAQATYVEAFEWAEFGRQVNMEEAKGLFPF